MEGCVALCRNRVHAGRGKFVGSLWGQVSILDRRNHSSFLRPALIACQELRSDTHLVLKDLKKRVFADFFIEGENCRASIFLGTMGNE